MSLPTPAEAGVASEPSSPLIEASALARAFGSRRAVDGVSFALGAGECLALFGPNGAGKTTLLRMLAGLLKPTAGTARVAGVALPGGAAARGAVGIISHQSMLYPALTARENIEFAARLHGVRDPRRAAIDVLAAMQVADRADWPVRALSRGMQQRVSIARAMAHGPRAVLLDEPFTGLDAAGAAALTAALEELTRRGAALMLVTHNLDEGLALATQVAVMVDGRFVRHEPRARLDASQFGSEYRRQLTGRS